ncbi:tubulin-specific chaperone A [Monosporozyma servazzii]
MAPTQLEIKVKSLQRLMKEESYYIQEKKDQKELLSKLEADKDVDPYELKKQKEILEDTERLLPTLYTKIQQFKENLEEYVKSYEGEESTDLAKEVAAKADDMLASNI